MSYYNQGPHPGQNQYPPYPQQQQGGYQPQQGYSQGYSQGPPPPQMNQGYQQGWGQPPQGNHPPQGAPPYPPQGGGYGPPQGQYNKPPQGQYNQHPQGQYGHPPPGQYQQPPPGQYGAPPQGGNYGPPPGQYGGPPPPPQPSPGYVPGQQSQMDMSRAADELRAAMKGFGTDEAALIRVLAPLDPLQVNSVKTAFHQRHRRDLMKDIHSETSGHFRDGLLAIVRGPLEQDCHTLHEAIKGLGTKESAMNDVLLGRSNADLNAIKRHYYSLYGRSVEADVRDDLSMKTEKLFDIVVQARRNEETTPVLPQQTDKDVEDIYRATEGRAGTDQIVVCGIVATRSDGQLRAIAQAYHQRYHRSLDQVIQNEFSGHMKHALLYMLRSAEDPAKHDAQLLEDAMRGMGTNDDALVRRIIRVHWDKQRLQQCKAAFKHFYHRDLAAAIRSETRGDYERLMLVIDD